MINVTGIRKLAGFREDITKTILPFVLPLMAEQGFIMLMGIVNAGMASSAGTDVASAVGLVNAITAMVISILSALALGGTVVVARYIGAGSPDSARRGAGQALCISVAGAVALGLGMAIMSGPVVDILYGMSTTAVRANAKVYLFITALGYPLLAVTLSASGNIRGTGDTRTPMMVNIVMNIVNVLAGRVFIFGASAGGLVLARPMGAAGAALAITSARAVGAVIFLVILTRGSSVVRLRGLVDLRPDRATLGLIFIVGIPASVESLMFTGGKLITQTFLAGLGEIAMTADYLASVTAGLIQVPVSSLSMAAAPLVSGCLGSGDKKGARRVIYASLLIGGGSLLAISAVSLPYIHLVVGLSSPRADVVELASTLLRFFLFVIPVFWGSSFIIPSGLRGAGDGRYTMWVAIFSMWIFRVGMGWLLSHPLGFGVLGIWIAMAVDWVIRSLFFVPRLLSEAWTVQKAAKS